MKLCSYDFLQYFFLPNEPVNCLRLMGTLSGKATNNNNNTCNNNNNNNNTNNNHLYLQRVNTAYKTNLP